MFICIFRNHIISDDFWLVLFFGKKDGDDKAYNVYKFPKYFTDTNVKLLIAIFVVFLIIQLLLLIRTRKYLFSFILNTLFIGLSIYFILNNNSDKVFIYYYLVMFFGLFNLIRFLQFLTLNHRVEK